MKKTILLLSLSLLTFSAVNAQVDTTNVQTDSYNRWSIEISSGQAKGSKPYAIGYFGNDNAKFLGSSQINHFAVAVRYMTSPTFGFKSQFSYDDIKNPPGTSSLPFEMQHIQITAEGVLNMTRLVNLQKQSGRFGLLLHFGMQASRMTPQMGSHKGEGEYNGGIVGGVTPQYRIYKRVSVFADLSINSNVRQHYNWDGSLSAENNNLTGSMYSASLGLSFSLGKNKIHGDWAVIQDQNDAKIDSLNNRIAEIEQLMNDSDKDGVPDYLDVELNSITGAAVDTKGRMVDLNNNGVPDELEKYVDGKVSDNNTSTNSSVTTNNTVAQLINDGYIAAYFDTAKSIPNSASADNIGFVLNYLRNNPTKSVDITGYADEIGGSNYNNKLSNSRAKSIKDILVKAGINESRITITPRGEDDSVDKKSEWARRLVRKAIFTIK